MTKGEILATGMNFSKEIPYDGYLYVTTGICCGRMSVYLDGRLLIQEFNDPSTSSSQSGAAYAHAKKGEIISSSGSSAHGVGNNTTIWIFPYKK